MDHKLLLNALKKYLKLKGITYAQLAEMLDISVPSVQRIFTNGNITLERYVKICEIIGITMGELAKLEEISGGLVRYEFTEEQDKFFAKPENKNYLAFFRNLLAKKSVEEIVEEFNISESNLVRILAGLEKLGLIEWLPGNKVKRTNKQFISWKKDGPSFKAYVMRELESFLAPYYKENDYFLKATNIRLSPNSQKKWMIRFDQLVEELKKDMNMEELVGIPTEDVGLVLAIRPYVPNYMSEFDFSDW